MSAVNQQAKGREHGESRRNSTAISWNRVGTYAALALVCFLLGFVPMWLKARSVGFQRDSAQQELRLSQMQNSLSAAVIDARRGEYEPARQTTSDFFISLRQQIDAGDESILTQSQRESVMPLLSERDDIITLLARNDPASVDRLSDIYMSYRQAMADSGLGKNEQN